MPPVVGTSIGHYRLLEQIGAGGMGAVYRAHDERLDRDVALKILSAGTLADSSSRRRFRHEALTLSRLSHPNIAVIHDVGSHGELDYLVMEYVPGTTLSHRTVPLPEREVLRLGLQLAHGLSAAHASGVVHRDLKPGNVRVTPDGLLKILDFGLAHRILGSDDSATTTSSFVAVGRVEGTPPYMAPEQLRGDPPDTRSDIYAAGAVLYELSTGRPPFLAGQFVRLADQILHEPPPAPRTINPELSAGLEEVIVKALDKDPDRRYQDARELAVDLERLITPSSVAPAKTRRLRISRRVVAAAAVPILVALAWLGWSRLEPPSAFQTKDWVLVGDFSNKTGRSDFDLLEVLLATDLRQSYRLNVLDRQRAAQTLELMRRDPASPIDEQTGLDICRREGVEVLLTGSIERAGPARVVIRGMTAVDRQVLFVETEEAPDGRQVKQVAETLADRLSRDLRESMPRVPECEPLARVMSPSTAAVERYDEAVKLLAEGNSGEAVIRLNGALELDPEFAMARSLLARIYRDLGKAAEQNAQLRLAFEHRDRLNRRERLLVEGFYFTAQERYAQARDSLRNLVGIDKDDWEARFELANALDFTGQQAEAIVHMREALRLNPSYPRIYAGLARLLTLEAKEDEALTVYQAARARGLTTNGLELNAGLAFFGRLDLDRAQGQFDRLSRTGDPTGRLYLTRIDLFRGQLATSAAQLAHDIREDQAAKAPFPERARRYLLGRVYLLQGRPDLAVSEARRIAPTDPTVKVQHLYFAGLLFTRAGRQDEARRVLERLRRVESDSPEAFVGACTRVIQAQIAGTEQRWKDAEESFRDADALYPQYEHHLGLARLYEQTRRWADAAKEWELVVGPMRGDLFRNGFAADWVLAQFALGRVYRQLGHVVKARQAMETALQAWRDADSDLADLREGKEDWRRLTGESWPSCGAVGLRNGGPRK
jgi:serine/threonine protein kinase/tetratricopeptide (TPR) repeat protein